MDEQPIEKPKLSPEMEEELSNGKGEPDDAQQSDASCDAQS